MSMMDSQRAYVMTEQLERDSTTTNTASLRRSMIAQLGTPTTTPPTTPMHMGTETITQTGAQKTGGRRARSMTAPGPFMLGEETSLSQPDSNFSAHPTTDLIFTGPLSGLSEKNGNDDDKKAHHSRSKSLDTLEIGFPLDIDECIKRLPIFKHLDDEQ